MSDHPNKPTTDEDNPTPAMIDAGCAIAWTYDLSCLSEDEMHNLVSEVYAAMRKKKQ